MFFFPRISLPKNSLKSCHYWFWGILAQIRTEKNPKKSYKEKISCFFFSLKSSEKRFKTLFEHFWKKKKKLFMWDFFRVFFDSFLTEKEKKSTPYLGGSNFFTEKFFWMRFSLKRILTPILSIFVIFRKFTRICEKLQKF